jgi:translation initiation factor IF-2
MRRFVQATFLLLVAAAQVCAQDAAAAERQIEGLREQLRVVTEQEARLQERLRQLEADMEPQSIERSVAAVGTTDARALRDQRRQQLERQKAGVEGQLTSLAASRARLEAAISTAEAEAVRLRAAALGAANAPPRAAPAAPPRAAPAAPPRAAPAAKPPPAAAKKSKPAPRKTKPRKGGRPRRRS